MKNNNLLLVIFIVVLFNSIVYSTLNSSMFINGDAHIRVDKDIRITNVAILEQVNGAYETYNSDYSKNTTSMQVTLPSSDSYIVYEVTITNKGDTDYEVTNILEESYSNSNIKYELVDIEKGKLIDKGTTHTFKIKFTTTENNPDNKAILVLKYNFEEYYPSLYKVVANESKSLDKNIDFSVAPTKETSGVYEMNSTKDYEYPVYYYRGIVDNNNVDFAGFCWKIVRTTETGGVKLIYNGVVASDGSCNNTGGATHIGLGKYNIGKSCGITGVATDVGYMYGTDFNSNEIDSNYKQMIDKWYLDNMIEYTSKLEDTVWCNDRSIYNIDSNNNIYFSGTNRLTYNKEPSLECSRPEDRFTVDKINGNGKLTYPIAIITADEALFASPSGYLYTGLEWYTLTPAAYNNVNECGYQPRMFELYNKLLGEAGLNYNHGMRPSVSLNNYNKVTKGNGSILTPYKIN